MKGSDTMPFYTDFSVNLIGKRILNVSVQFEELTLDTVNRAIAEADKFVQLFLEAEMERCEYIINPTQYPTSKLNDGYNAAQHYLLQFNVNMLDYLKMVNNSDWKPVAVLVIEDAMIVSRLIRDTLIHEYERKQQNEES